MWTKHDVDEKKLRNISIVLFLAAVIGAASAATQYAAAKLNYQEALYGILVTGSYTTPLRCLPGMAITARKLRYFSLMRTAFSVYQR